jgi:hypothetical protein
MYIRDLQSRVQFLRQDLPAGFASQALQDAARLVARKTGIVRVRKYGHVDAGQVRVNLASFMGAVAGEFEVLRPTQIWYCPGQDRASVFISFLTATALTIPLATAAGAHDFYIATEAIVATDGVTSYSMSEGDVIQAVNGVWKITPFYKFRVASDIRKERLIRALGAPLNSVGYFCNYIVEKDDVILNPVPVNVTAIMMECSIVPRKEFDNIDFPLDAEDAMLAATKAQIYGTPNKSGGGADHGLAKYHQAQAEGEITLVRAIAEGGYGDSEMAPPPKFGA